jgi:hypothetical protein
MDELMKGYRHVLQLAVVIIIGLLSVCSYSLWKIRDIGEKVDHVTNGLMINCARSAKAREAVRIIIHHEASTQDAEMFDETSPPIKC